MKRKFLAGIFFLAVLLAQGQQNAYTSKTLVSGTASIGSNRKHRPVRITVRRLDLDTPEADGAIRMQVKAFSVMTLCSGRIETDIEGAKSIRLPDDFWVVEAGHQMNVKVSGESAILQVIEVTP